MRGVKIIDKRVPGDDLVGVVWVPPGAAAEPSASANVNVLAGWTSGAQYGAT